MTWYDLDFVFWYNLDFYKNRGDKKPLHYYWFQITKAYDWDEKKIEILPVLNTRGIKIALEEREETPVIEKAKNTYMESRYTKNSE